MKIWLLAGAGAALALSGLTAAWLWLRPDLDSSRTRRNEGAARAAPSLAAHADQHTDPSSQGIEALLADGSPEAWKKIVSRYPAGDLETKRKVIQQIGHMPNIGQALRLMLATVGDDPVPASEDPLLADSAEVMKTYFKKPEHLQEARRSMLLQKTDKRRWVVANAMITFAKDLDKDSQLYPEKTRLEAKLVDLHATVHDGFVKSSIVDGMHSLGSGDAAMILAKGPAVKDDELKSVKAEQAAVAEVLEGAGQRK